MISVEAPRASKPRDLGTPKTLYRDIPTFWASLQGGLYGIALVMALGADPGILSGSFKEFRAEGIGV